jgi:hypothetical protein
LDSGIKLNLRALLDVLNSWTVSILRVALCKQKAVWMLPRVNEFNAL